MRNDSVHIHPMLTTKNGSDARRVVVLAFPGALSLDVLGPFEIFQCAARLLAMRSLPPPVDPTDDLFFTNCEFAYQVELVSVREGPVKTTSGAELLAHRSLASVEGALDTLVVAGGNVRRMMQTIGEDPNLLEQIRRVASLARRVTSVCTGSFLLACAGLLNGKRATTHWAACDVMQNAFPSIEIEREPIYTKDGQLYTSAGASAGMDLALALVREDYGSELSREIARWLVLYMQRSGGQSQLSVPLRTQAADREPLRDLQAFILEHPEANLSVGALAARAGMSVRNFTRAFRREVGLSPAAYVQAVRVEAARRKLELGRASIEEVAAQVGFGSVETLRRAFVRETGAPPSACRTAHVRRDRGARAASMT